MKINPDQSSAVKPDAERDARKVGKAGERFEDLFSRIAEQVASQTAGPQSTAAATSQGVESTSRLLPTQLLFPPEETAGFEGKAMDSFDNLLSRWEKYAHQLTADPQGLRQANGILEEISTNISALKANWPQHGSSNRLIPELRSMLDELEVMAVTERIKFNRGDYI